MSDHDDVAMNAAYEEELPQTAMSQFPDDAPATEAENFFAPDDEDDDGFGDFEDAAWETAPEPTSPTPTLPYSEQNKIESAAPTTAAVISVPNIISDRTDILSLAPADFQAAATSVMSPFSPLNASSTTKSGTIINLKDLKNKFPQLRENYSRGPPASFSFSNYSWNGSTGQARLLHRLNLGPAPVVDSPLLSQPLPTRVTLRPSSSGSLYSNKNTTPAVAAVGTGASSFPAPPPARQQRSALVAPPPQPPQQTFTISTATTIQKSDPAVVDLIKAPDTSSSLPSIKNDDTTEIVQNSVELPNMLSLETSSSIGNLTNGFDELTLISTTEEPEEKEKEVEYSDEQQEQQTAPASPPSSLPYQNPFLSPRTGNEDVFVQGEQENEEGDAYFNLFIDAGEEETNKKETETEFVPLTTTGVEVERENNEKAVKEDEMLFVEDDDNGDDYLYFQEVEAPLAAAPVADEVSKVEEWVNPFEVPEEGEKPVEIMEIESQQQPIIPAAGVVSLDQQQNEQPDQPPIADEELPNEDDADFSMFVSEENGNVDTIELASAAMDVKSTAEKEVTEENTAATPTLVFVEEDAEEQREEEVNRGYDSDELEWAEGINDGRVVGDSSPIVVGEVNSAPPLVEQGGETKEEIIKNYDSDELEWAEAINDGKSMEGSSPIIGADSTPVEQREDKEEETNEVYDSDELEWAEAINDGRVVGDSSPIVVGEVNLTPSIIVEEEVVDEEVKLGIHEKKEEEELVAVLAAVNGEDEGNRKKEVIEEKEQQVDDDEDDFDDFCEADDAPPPPEDEIEEAVAVPPTAAAVAEDLAATLPDLSFMLSGSLIKPHNT